MAYNSNYVSISRKDSVAEDRWIKAESKQKFRSPFAKDRDRILYSRSFLRLRGKTQVFMSQNFDYLRTRLTHTLEVGQIAKTVASALGLNMELVEAIALGHDVGHTPFGHVGERTLDNILNECEKTAANIDSDKRGFKHNLQSLRLLCELEQGATNNNYEGLNLTLFTLWGIVYHTSVIHKPCDKCGDKCKAVHKHISCKRTGKDLPNYSFYSEYLNRIAKYWSFEGFVVKQADEIAQRHHDIEDSIRMGILKKEELVSIMEKLLDGVKLSNEDKTNLANLKKNYNVQDDLFIALFSRFIVNFYVVNLIKQAKVNIKELEKKYKIRSHVDFIKLKDTITDADYSEIIVFSDDVKKFDKTFQHYLITNILSSYQAQSMDGKGEYIIRRLFDAYVSNPAQLPDHVIMQFYRDLKLTKTVAEGRNEIMNHFLGNESAMARCIADYIGGMTDTYAYEQYDKLYGTRV